MIDEILENVQGDDLKVLTNALSEVSKFFEKLMCGLASIDILEQRVTL